MIINDNMSQLKDISCLAVDYVSFLRNIIKDRVQIDSNDIWVNMAPTTNRSVRESIDLSSYILPSSFKLKRFIQEYCGNHIVFNPVNMDQISLKEFVKPTPLRITVPGPSLPSPTAFRPITSATLIVAGGAGAGDGAGSSISKPYGKTSELDQVIEYLTNIRELESRLSKTREDKEHVLGRIAAQEKMISALQ
jgi:hypothetical protein